MKFQLTLNMPSRQGQSVHQVIIEHPSKSVSDFINMMNAQTFFIAQEWYRDKNEEGENAFYMAGELGINRDWVGKVKGYKT